MTRGRRLGRFQECQVEGDPVSVSLSESPCVDTLQVSDIITKRKK